MSKHDTVTKKSCQKAHFKKRLKERYNLECNKAEYNDLIGQIKSNGLEIVHLYNQSNRVSVKWVPFKGTRVVAVYDNIRHTLVTALPAECRDIQKIEEYLYRDSQED